MTDCYEAGVLFTDGFRVRKSMRVHVRQPDDPERQHFQWTLCGLQLRTEQVYRGWIIWRRCETKPEPGRLCARCRRALEAKEATRA